MSTHAIERTSPMGEDFIGTCVLCGKKGLRGADALKECPNPARISQDRALLDLIEGPEPQEGGQHEQ